MKVVRIFRVEEFKGRVKGGKRRTLFFRYYSDATSMHHWSEPAPITAYEDAQGNIFHDPSGRVPVVLEEVREEGGDDSS